MEEIWKDVIGYEGLYQVSNLGNVKTMAKSHVANGRVLNYKPKELKKQISNVGYYRAALWINSKSKKHSVHRLVASAFIPNPDNKKYVNHKDSNRLNNNLSNLEWCTGTENIKHCIKKGRYNIGEGKRHIACRYVLDFNTGVYYYSVSEAKNYIDIKKQGVMCV